MNSEVRWPQNNHNGWFAIGYFHDDAQHFYVMKKSIQQIQLHRSILTQKYLFLIHIIRRIPFKLVTCVAFDFNANKNSPFVNRMDVKSALIRMDSEFLRSHWKYFWKKRDFYGQSICSVFDLEWNLIVVIRRSDSGQNRLMCAAVQSIGVWRSDVRCNVKWF